MQLLLIVENQWDTAPTYHREGQYQGGKTMNFKLLNVLKNMFFGKEKKQSVGVSDNSGMSGFSQKGYYYGAPHRSQPKLRKVYAIQRGHHR